ncbi:MAG: hypothetical protein ACRCSI_08460, partial [Eubacterium aggregans]
GSEFLDQDSIERSVLTKKKRTTAYYCHPKCPEERGSNENYNKIIRRFAISLFFNKSIQIRHSLYIPTLVRHTRLF